MNFPSSVIVEGVEYSVLTSYRGVFEYFELAQNPILTGDEKAYGACLIFFISDVPENWIEGYTELSKWLLCGSDIKNLEPQEKVYDFKQDYNYIWAGFMSQHGIDLNKNDTMHWWAFKALFDELSDDSKIKQIITIRTMKLPDPTKEPEKYFDILELKEKFALKEG